MLYLNYSMSWHEHVESLVFCCPYLANDLTILSLTKYLSLSVNDMHCLVQGNALSNYILRQNYNYAEKIICQIHTHCIDLYITFLYDMCCLVWGLYFYLLHSKIDMSVDDK